MKPPIKSEEQTVEKRTHRRRCPDFDADCNHVRDHVSCFIGDELTGPAGGYCPFLMGFVLKGQDHG